MSCQEYMDRFQNAADFVIHIAGSVPLHPSLVDAALKGKNLERRKATKNRYPNLKKTQQIASCQCVSCWVHTKIMIREVD